MLFKSGTNANNLIKLRATSVLLACAVTGIAHAQPQLQSDTSLSTAGYFQLSWQTEASGQFELQQAQTADFSDAHNIYQGEDQATVISGLPDGNYFYRVRHQSESSWSKPVEVEVKHHPLSRAFGFFTLGAAMFLATLGGLIKGARSSRSS